MLCAFGWGRQRWIDFRIKSLYKYSLNFLHIQYVWIFHYYFISFSIILMKKQLHSYAWCSNNKPNYALLVCMSSSRTQSLFWICCTVWRASHQLRAPGNQLRTMSVGDCRESLPRSLTSYSSDWQTPLTGKVCPNTVKSFTKTVITICEFFTKNQ